MTTAIARNDFDYLDRPHAAQNFTTAPTRKAAEDNSVSQDVAATEAGAEKDTSLFGEDGFGFNDFLDIINPLQHIPLVSTLYRELTGDELSPGARMIGGGIFGGGIGLASSVINSAIEMETGKDIGDHVLALFSSEEEAPAVLAAKPETTDAAIKQAEVAPSPAAPLLAAQQAASATVPTSRVSVEPAAKQAQELAMAPAQTVAVKAKAAAGLEWKEAPPNLQQGLQNLQKVQGQNLSEAQLSQILGAFNGAKIVSGPTTEAKITADRPEPVKTAPMAPTPAPSAARAYETGRNVSDYAYMDRAV